MKSPDEVPSPIALPNPGAKPQAIRVERRGRVAVIAYSRPSRRNAWSVVSVRETIAAIRQANADPGVGAILLTGDGDVYCAGADLKEERTVDPETGRRMTPATLTMGTGDGNWIGLLRQSKPMIIAVNGPAIGIGATHTLAADIRVAAASAIFSFPFLRLGAMPECGSTGLLPGLIGYGRALDLCLRSGTVDAQEALRIGLVTSVFPDAELLESALKMAEQLAELPELQLRLTRRMFQENSGARDPDAIMTTESGAFVELLKALRRDKPL